MLRLGLDILCRNAAERSDTVPAVVMPTGFDADAFIQHAHDRFALPLGVGLAAVKGKVFRIGHLGGLNELGLLGALAGIEMALKTFGVSVKPGVGFGAAEEVLLFGHDGARP
jgi:alanine-glyoxylate transaminase/serine-glyoxylate transaminase/serine-pyruvate transaminase